MLLKTDAQLGDGMLYIHAGNNPFPGLICFRPSHLLIVLFRVLETDLQSDFSSLSTDSQLIW